MLTVEYKGMYIHCNFTNDDKCTVGDEMGIMFRDENGLVKKFKSFRAAQLAITKHLKEK